MPFELFNYLISGGFSSDPRERVEFRRSLEPIISRSTTAEAFWTAVETGASAFIENQREERALFAQLKPSPTEEARNELRQRIKNVQQPQCLLRAKALASVAQ